MGLKKIFLHPRMPPTLRPINVAAQTAFLGGRAK